ncbi:acyltransferase family protein [Komagataeibacter sucrofermentans]|uniref:Acyltransferase 3 domain-containing protein n=1 Tax=Komagataeibacter sucrofermentans TaxID=1053551 RepID=A0A318QJB1_9PROT|nr:acyltransferase [Komagataeibacter sucrofermentans]PYD78510.1 hypothetical protein CFR77_10600 [Komagataeibacter sucrofermentans]
MQALIMIGFIFICMSALVLVFSTPLFSFLDKAETGRNHHIDGLRFFLAIFVAFHHMIYCYRWYHGLDWTPDNILYPFNAQLGPFAVTLFFMLSSYLITRRNYSNTAEWIQFYIKRFFRIAPMAWFSALICIVTALVYGNGFHDIDAYAASEWMNFGISLERHDINSFYKMWVVNAGVMWTLSWEWMLYFSLPIIMILREKLPPFTVSALMIFSCAYGYAMYNDSNILLLSCFAYGILARDLQTQFKSSNAFKCIVSISMLVFIFGFGFGFGFPETAYTPYKIFFSFVLFLQICQGYDFGGLLRLPGVVRLGEISYSFYLLHGTFLFYVNRAVFNTHISPLLYGAILVVTFLCTAIASSLTFIFIEKPGMRLGKLIGKRFVIQPSA